MKTVKTTKSSFGLWISILLLSGCTSTPDQTWYRGNTHTHTFWSDGNHFPEMAAAWYKNNGYQFVVLTDHNIRPTQNEWVDLTKKKKTADNPVAALRAEFGEQAVSTKQNDQGKTLHRLLSYDEVAKQVDVPGEFITIAGEELTAYVHMNAINTASTIGADRSIRENTASAKDSADRVHRYEQEQGNPIFLQLNHPNWRYEMTAELLAATQQAEAFELINPSCNNLGDEHSPSTETMWDIASVLRLKKYGIPPIWGVAADDAHHFHVLEETSDHIEPGSAFIMAEADELSGNAIAQALKNGAFYSSTGVLLNQVYFDSASRTLTIQVDPADPGTDYEIQFIGTPTNVSLNSEPVPPYTYTKKFVLRKDGKPVMKDGEKVMIPKNMARTITQNYSDQIGTVQKTVKGKEKASYTIPDDMLYIRCKVTDISHPGFTWGKETISRSAWTQPVGWKL